MKRIIAFFCLCILLIVTACDNKTAEMKGKYISFTASMQKDENTIETSIYSFDMSSEKTEKIYTYENRAQYPIGVYDRKDNKVYYSQNLVEQDVLYSREDGIMVYDVETKDVSVFDDRFLTVNYIFPIDDHLFVGGELIEEIKELNRGIKPYLVDKQSKDIQNYDWNDELHIDNLGFNSATKTIYAAVVPFYQLYEQETPESTMYQFDSNFEIKPIKEIGRKVVGSIIPNDDTYLYRTEDDRHFKDESDKAIYDATAPFEEYEHLMGRSVYYDSHNKVVFYIDGNALRKFNLKDHEDHLLYSVDEGPSYINNAILLSN